MHIVPTGITHKGGFQKQWSFNIYKLVFSLLVVLFLDITNLVLELHLALLKGVMTHFYHLWPHGGYTPSSLISNLLLCCNMSERAQKSKTNAFSSTFKLVGKNIMYAAVPWYFTDSDYYYFSFFPRWQCCRDIDWCSVM